MAQIILDWASIVGPVFASQCEPRRISGGTLTIMCWGPIAMELQHMAIEVMNRINAHAGYAFVRAIRFTQSGQFNGPPRSRPPPKVTSPVVVEAVAGMPAGELRDALATLGSHVLADGTPSTGRRNKVND